MLLICFYYNVIITTESFNKGNGSMSEDWFSLTPDNLSDEQKKEKKIIEKTT